MDHRGGARDYLYCALTANGFENAVLLAVSHGGDSDSTGAVAGNILGAL
jgi:ADP-ribosylglycohydrolase